MPIEINQKAPVFSLPDQEEKIHTISDYAGKWVLLYFYPKDDTPGCTKEACSVRDNMPKFEGLDTVVLGISADSVNSHKKFAEKYKLPFTLLSDRSKETIELYGAWETKNILGKEIKVISRTSFLINPEGIVVKIYKNVNPRGHAEQVLADLNKLKTID